MPAPFVITIRRFAAGAPDQTVTEIAGSFADRDAARRELDELWMNEYRSADAEVASVRQTGKRGLSVIPTGLSADMKAVTMHSEADGVITAVIYCIERG